MGTAISTHPQARTINRKPTWLFLAFALAVCPSFAVAFVADQGQIKDTDGVVNLGTDNWSQSITTGIAGPLAAIQIDFERESTALLPGIFNFSIYDGANPPTGTPLLSQQLTISLEDLEPLRPPFDQEPSLYTWDVSSANLLFDVGDVFTFAFSAEESGFEFAGNDPPGYVGGELFRNGVALPSSAVNDIAFISYVVPIPAAVWLFGSALGLLGWIRRPTA
jgi:hypothetical protein